MTVGPGNTEEQLRKTLGVLADEIEARPPAYRTVLADWKRRERRRRLLLALLVAVVFALADIIGLWALNQAPAGTNVIFDDRSSVHQTDPGRGVGQP